MREEELEKTKPIEVLADLEGSRTSKFANKELEENSRAKRYQDNVEEQEKIDLEEESEEALAEKNIALAETLLAEEKEKKLKEENENNESSKNNNDKKSKKTDKKSLMDKWKELDKNKKIIFIIIGILVLALVIALVVIVVGLIGGKNKDKGTTDNNPSNPSGPIIEQAPEIVDNFYYKDGTLHFLDDSKDELGTYTCENKDSALCYVALNNYRDSFDVPKLEYENGKENIGRIPIYNKNYVFVVDNKDEKATEVKLYSMNEEKVVNNYVDVKAYDDSYVIVADSNKKYGLLNMEDGLTEVIAPKYTYLGMINGQDNLIANNSKGYIVVNKKDKVLSSPLANNFEIKNYNDTFVVVKISDEYSVYNYAADSIASGYRFITVDGDYVTLVDSDRKIYTIDKDANKYSEGEIKLDSKEYVKTYVYKEDGTLETVKRSFDMKFRDDHIEYTIYKDDDEAEPKYENVYLAEGLVNRKNNYVNYFNGKLYFYKDEEKTDLIGSYTCTNKNEVNSEADSMSNCFVAKDTIYEKNDMMSKSDYERKAYAPIINNRFVFIQDGNENIKLYDLETNKSLGFYKSVNTYTKNNDYAITSVKGKIDVVALSQRNNMYGVLQIDESSASIVYTFEYNNMEKIGNYYEVLDSSGNWKVIYESGKESTPVKGKIMGYTSNHKYIKAVLSDAYSVYNDNGEIVTSETYKYVELYDTYYAGVNNDKELFIYDYKGNKLTSEGVKIGDYPYTSTDNPAFKVKKNAANYIISVYDGKEYKDVVANNKPTEPENPEIPGVPVGEDVEHPGN